MALGFSYMSFAILDKFEAHKGNYYETENHKFDKEPFDYLFNMSTGIMDSMILDQDYDCLTTVLDQLEK